MTDFRALCAELAYELDAETGYTRNDGTRITHPTVAEARAALAQPEPQGLTDEELTNQEIEEWADATAEVPLEEMDPEVHGWRRCFTSEEFCNTIREALSRFGRPAVEPVPVAERLPRPEDCDTEGLCWWWDKDTMSWIKGLPEYCTGSYGPWLPHHALPVPQ